IAHVDGHRRGPVRTSLDKHVFPRRTWLAFQQWQNADTAHVLVRRKPSRRQQCWRQILVADEGLEIAAGLDHSWPADHEGGLRTGVVERAFAVRQGLAVVA